MMLRLFKHYVPVQILILALIDILILYGSVYLGVALRFFVGDLAGVYESQPLVPKTLTAITFTTVMFVSMTVFGLYEREAIGGQWRYYVRLMMSYAAGLIVMALVFYAMPRLFLGRGAFVLTALSSMLGIVVLRGIFLRVVNREVLQRRLLILGTGSRAHQVESLMNQNGTANKFLFIGYVPLGANVSPAIDKSRILEKNGSLLAIATHHAVDEIVVGVRDRRGGSLPMDELLECKLEGIDVIDIPTFFEREKGHVQLDSLTPSWMVFSDGFSRSTSRALVKRLFDITASLLLLLLTAPIMAVTAIAIAIESGFPVLYRQIRVGECGQMFEILKFRSMRTDAEADGLPRWSGRNDDRVTRVGRVMRKLRIDELPQILNVLKGDMSFVGPRPERPYFVRELTKVLPYYPNRHTVKPGITGWAQIRYPAGDTVEDARQKLQFDLYYAKNHSLFLDIVILFQTMHVVLFGSREHERTAHEGA
jgi:sugar transferase (PEP-CTERM system associated)